MFLNWAVMDQEPMSVPSALNWVASQVVGSDLHGGPFWGGRKKMAMAALIVAALGTPAWPEKQPHIYNWVLGIH